MGPKQPICPEAKFFGTNHCYYLYLPIGPFHCAKFKKIHTTDPELWQCTIFGPKVVQTNFFKKNYYYHFHLPINPFHCEKKKNNKIKNKKFQRIQSYEDVQFMDPKCPISPNKNFFRKPVNEPCFFYSCLSTCQESKSDINLLVKYWWLKNTEISLA